MSTLNRWFPLTHQIIVLEDKSDNYLRSIWIGMTAMFINLPVTLFMLLTGKASLRVCGMMAFALLASFPILGLRNELDSADITVEEMYSRLEQELNGEDF